MGGGLLDYHNLQISIIQPSFLSLTTERKHQNLGNGKEKQWQLIRFYFILICNTICLYQDMSVLGPEGEEG